MKRVLPIIIAVSILMLSSTSPFWSFYLSLSIAEIPKQIPAETTKSGKIEGTEETWDGINQPLRHDYRELDGGISLNECEVKYGFKPNLTEEEIIKMIIEFKNDNEGKLPNEKSRKIKGTNMTWSKINQVLRSGSRGLDTKGSSLSKFKIKHKFL